MSRECDLVGCDAPGAFEVQTLEEGGYACVDHVGSLQGLFAAKGRSMLVSHVKPDTITVSS